MAAAGTATNVGGAVRDLRKQVFALIEDELILPAAVARECEVSVTALEQWLDGYEESLLARRVEEFLDARTSIWLKIAAADNQ
jgi:hypothetical protein